MFHPRQHLGERQSSDVCGCLSRSQKVLLKERKRGRSRGWKPGSSLNVNAHLALETVLSRAGLSQFSPVFVLHGPGFFEIRAACKAPLVDKGQCLWGPLMWVVQALSRRVKVDTACKGKTHQTENRESRSLLFAEILSEVLSEGLTPL
ncbi:hypothetical protein MG293_014285 [Ovis ammon polii]|uniref:Uncharacterized protein n=1 Tax=Ovis ammon polii TaxID=230172 RepID=A0AAD4TXX6_OVIAM|nr:hypothetical protein MG293_014285 [Ovis ammon polii]KAI4561454.1 hypothetical protein MJT46_012144 [Ovis ammon polii x Ovis aries]